MKKDKKKDRFVLAAGTVIHFAGLPFELACDTIVLGKISNIPSLKAISGVILEVSDISEGWKHAKI